MIYNCTSLCERDAEMGVRIIIYLHISTLFAYFLECHPYILYIFNVFIFMLPYRVGSEGSGRAM